MFGVLMSDVWGVSCDACMDGVEYMRCGGGGGVCVCVLGVCVCVCACRACMAVVCGVCECRVYGVCACLQLTHPA